MNIELEDNHISISHRLPSRLKQTSTSNENIKPPPIIVKFTSQKKRNEIYYKRKNIPQISDFEIPQMKELYTCINENLTNVRRSLLYEARKLKKIQGYNFVWTHMGDILARKNEKSKVLKIRTLIAVPARGAGGAIAPPSFKDLGKIKIFWAVRRKYLGKTIVFQAAI